MNDILWQVAYGHLTDVTKISRRLKIKRNRSFHIEVTELTKKEVQTIRDEIFDFGTEKVVTVSGNQLKATDGVYKIELWGPSGKLK